MNVIYSQKEIAKTTILIELIDGADIKESFTQAVQIHEETKKNIVFYHNGINATIVISSGNFEVKND